MRKLIACLLIALTLLSMVAVAEPAIEAINGADAVRTASDLYLAIPSGDRQMLVRVPLAGGEPICVDRADSFEDLLPYDGGIAYLKHEGGSSAIMACNGNNASSIYGFGADSANGLAWYGGKMLVLVNTLLHSVEPATGLCLRLSGAAMLDFVVADGYAYYLSDGDRMEYTAQLEDNQTISTQAGCVYRLDLNTGETTLLLKSGGVDLKLRDEKLFFHNLADAYAVRSASETLLLGRVYSMDVQLKTLNSECTEPDSGFWPMASGAVVWHSGALNLDTEAGNLALYSPENGATVVSDGEYLYAWEPGKQTLTQITTMAAAQVLYTGNLALAQDASLIIPETSLTIQPAPTEIVSDQAATGNDAWFEEFMDNANTASGNTNSVGSYKPNATPIPSATRVPSLGSVGNGSGSTGSTGGSASSSGSSSGSSSSGSSASSGSSYSVSAKYLETTGSVNLRSKPNLNASVLGSIPKGVVVNCTGKGATASNGGKWYQVKYDGMTGWISAAYAEKTSAPDDSYMGSVSNVDGKYVRITSGNVTLRKSPHTGGSYLDTIKEGKTVTFLGKQSKDSRGVKWFKVKYNGKTGWVSSAYSMITDSAASSSGDSVEIVGGNCTIRAKANKNAAVLGYINEGNTAEYLGKTSTDSRGVKWYKIEYDGITGWVSSIYADRV